jgi:hypothetical protein
MCSPTHDLVQPYKRTGGDGLYVVPDHCSLGEVNLYKSDDIEMSNYQLQNLSRHVPLTLVNQEYVKHCKI